MKALTKFVPAACLALALCSVGTGCASGPSVRTSYEPTTNFASFKTFALNHPNHPTPAPGGVDPFTVFRLRQMVYSQLAAQNYTAAPFDRAQLLVTVNAEARTHTEATPNHSYHYGYYGTEVRTTPTLMLTVDLVDAASKALVWHGSGEIVAHGRPDEAELWGLVQAILARFPPTAPGNE
ncbi:MAG TPA: DUF4136 domain-containing protein [Polyangiaceae bacterium]|nr:DUF4136 domain-containing protein [Polyangiaceae bacterium]